MHTVRVWAELSDDMFEAYEAEARRQGVPIETLIQHTVNCLITELDAEEHQGPCYRPPAMEVGSGTRRGKGSKGQ